MVTFQILRRAAIIAIIVGTILALLNHGDRLLQGQDIPYFKILLTYLVPFSVSSYSAISMKN
ncbi:MAG: nitrate/nitrite transporter NrtS [Halopseudomonas sp.]